MQKDYTLHEAARELNLTYGTMRQYVHHGKVKASKQGKNRMVPASEIARLKQRRAQK